MASKVVYDASFTADTNTAEANVKRYAQQITAANKTLQEAERTAKQSYQSQMLQAKAAGVSTEQLNKITQRYNQSLYSIGRTAQEVGSAIVQANRNATTTAEAQAEAVELVNKELQAQIAVTNELAAANAENNHEAVSGVQATSAAIRGIEGSGGIRAIENFLSKTLGLGPAMQAIFPLVGAAMFGKMLFDVGEKVYDVEQKAAHAGEAFDTAFGEMHSKSQTTIADLDLQAAKLQLNIDKISGHPGNGLAVALAEARKAADALGTSLAADRKQIDAIFKANSVGMMGGVLATSKTTGAQEKNVNRDLDSDGAAIARINNEQDAKLARSGNDQSAQKAVEAERRTRIRKVFDDRISNYANEVDRQQKAQQQEDQRIALDKSLADRGVRTGGSDKALDYSGSIKELSGVAQQIKDRRDIYLRGLQVADLTEQDGAAKQAKEQADARKRDSASAASAAKQDAERQRQQWEEQVRILKDGGQLSAEAESQAWNGLASSAKKGSENYIFASNKALEAMAHANADKRKLLDEALKMRGEFSAMQQKQVLGALMPGMNADAKGIQDQQISLRALLDAQRESTYQQALAQAQQDASVGTISKYDEQVRIQSLHTAEYAAQLKELQDALAAVDGQDNESIAKRNALQKQITDLSLKQQIDSMRDTANVAAQTWQGALTNANAAWVRDSQDSARQVANLYQSALGGINNSVVDLMTGGKGNFASAFQGIGKQIAGYGLQRAESGILGKFGFGGKADGSKGNPLHVTMDGAVGGSTSIPGSSIGGAANGFLKSALSFLPGGSLLGGLFGGGRAIGGGVDSGTTYLVGERGPELLTMGGAGHVTPNNQMRGALGGNVAYYTIHTSDGVTSEQVHQQVQSALKQAHPQVVRDSVHAITERSARRPASSR